MKIKIKKEDKIKIPKKILTPGPKVRDIKTNKAKSVDFKEPINSQIIEIKEEKEEEKPKISAKLIFPIIAAAFVIIAVFIYFFVFSQPKDTLSKFAPKETFFYAHLNFDKLLKNSENKNINSLLEKFGGGKNFENELDKFLNKNFLSKYNLSLKNDLEPILDKEAAFALYPGENEKIYPYIIFKIKDQKQFLSITEKINPKNLQELNVKGAKIQILLFDDPKYDLSFALIKNTAIISQNKELVEKIIQTYNTKNHLLVKADQKDFIQIYLNGQTLPQAILSFLPENLKTDNLLPYYLLLKKVQGLYFGINDKPEGLTINYHGPSNFKKPRSAPKLLPFIPADAIFVFLDYDLKNNYLATKENFQKNDDLLFSEKEKRITDKYFKNFEKELKEKYNLNINEDILPFFEEEAAFILLPKTNDKQQNFALLTKIKKPDDLEKKLENIFLNLFAAANLKEKPMKLTDGGEAIEFVPDKKAFEIKKEDKGEVKIFNLMKKADSKTLISYAIKDNILAIAQNKETIEKIIDSKERLNEEKTFSKTFQKIDGQKMENLVYLNVLGYLNYLGKSSSSKTFWQPVKNFLFGARAKDNETFGKGFLLIE
ncbi:MAG: DUF3352 domain-containing protein [Patescibacteria group bacterium]